MAIATFQSHPLRKACVVFGLVVVICLAQALIFAPYIWPLSVSWGDIDIKQVAHCFESTTLMTPAAFQIRRLPEVCTITGLSRTTIWRKVRAGTFPKPMMLSARTPGWADQDLVNYLEERRAAAGLPKLVDAA